MTNDPLLAALNRLNENLERQNLSAARQTLAIERLVEASKGFSLIEYLLGESARVVEAKRARADQKQLLEEAYKLMDSNFEELSQIYKQS